MIGKSYAVKTLSRQRRMIGSTVAIIGLTFGLIWIISDGLLVPSLLSAFLFGTIVTIVVINFAETSEINYIGLMTGGYPWLLWRGHFIQHQRMDPDVSEQIIPDTKNTVQIVPCVHVCRSQKDLMLFKLAIGSDYL